MMKGLLLFNQSSVLLFIDADQEFLESAYKKRLLQEFNNDQVAEHMYDPYDAEQMFVPFSASQNVMSQTLKNPYEKIICENNSITVSKQLDNILFIAVNGDGTEDEHFLNKKILVFHRILKFLYGPVLKQIKPKRLLEQRERQNYLTHILRTWCHLVQEEQSFLMEAVEQLYVNSVVNEKSLELLEMVVKKVSSVSSISNNHALLLVHGKLLSLYSSNSAYELQSADILTIILLACVQYPYNSELRADNLLRKPQPEQQQPQPSSSSHRQEEEEQQSEQQQPSPQQQKQEQRECQQPSSQQEVKEQQSKQQQQSLQQHKDEEQQSEQQQQPLQQQENEEHQSKRHDEQKHSLQQQDEQGSEQRQQPLSPQQQENEEQQSEQQQQQQHPVKQKSEDNLQSASPHVSQETEVLETSRTLSVVSDGSQSLGRDSVDNTATDQSKDVQKSFGIHEASCSCSEDLDNCEVSSADLLAVSSRNISDNVQHSSSSIEEDNENISSQSTSYNINKANIEASTEPKLASSGAKKQSRKRTGTTESSSQSTSSKSKPFHTSIKPIPVCLHTSACLFTPHQLFCIEVIPGIVLVIVLEQCHSSQSGLICQLHDLLNDITSGSSRGERLVRGDCQYTFDVLDMLLKKVTGSRAGHNDIKKNIKKNWENAVQKGLDLVLDKGNVKDVPDKILNSLSAMCDSLKDLFLHMFIQKSVVSTAMQEILFLCKQRIFKELVDYKDYLIVKAERNIAITSYIQDFPGMVFFIFVDRTTNQVIAPALNIDPDDKPEAYKATLFLKKKIWKVAHFMQQKLSQGYTTVLLRDGDFFISYYLWFEDNSHNPLVVQQPYKPLSHSPPPGILCGNLYRQLIRQCFPTVIPGSVHCLELICIHLGIVPTNLISVHIQQLSNQLWKMAEDGLAPISLL
ncbi:Hermansky-Pudlak syndrome 1 protein homolog isoform X2 [Octopus sinensis]|uniref:Hermansky-Pudlak syndrome 1 protein homolog isoform X2 n=1 Tax=Octopus sinensis TaxID=2607531 RepID=A0A7E6FD63_9MOLL|nr:Hermansky-Pudlak syndrome 1 protein homolog isoform X2 [Octopus sinensis]